MDGRLQRHSHILHSIFLWLLVVVALCLVGVGAWAVAHKLSEDTTYVTLGNTTFSAKIARSDKDLERGLGGVKKLGSGEGMLFVFDRSQRWPIWMKGMHIPIDIIWLDEQKQVVHIERNVQPDAEPYVTYMPPEPARYVLELPAGAAKKHAIKSRSTALFTLPERNR